MLSAWWTEHWQHLPALFRACVCVKWGSPSEAAKPVNNNDSKLMFAVLCFITCPAPRLVKGQMTLNKVYFIPPTLSLSLLSAPPCLGPTPTWEGQVARPWCNGIGQLHTEIDYPSNLRTASLTPGRNPCMNPPPPPIPFVPLSLCCQRHWGTTLSHRSRQGHSLAVPALFTICQGKWGSCGLCLGLRRKKKSGDMERWIGDEGYRLQELRSRVEQKKWVLLKFKDIKIY